MQFRIRLFLFLSALLVLGASPETAEARKNRPSSARAKAKKKKAKKAQAQTEKQLDEDPYGQEDTANGKEATLASESPDMGDEKERIAKTQAQEGSLRRSGRMEFDERLVKGQAAKSGAVYLFKRTPRRLPGLVPMRRSYRKRIVEPVLGQRELKPAQFSTETNLSAKSAEKKNAPFEKNQQTDKLFEQNANREESIGQGSKDKKAGRRKQKSGGKK